MLCRRRTFYFRHFGHAFPSRRRRLYYGRRTCPSRAGVPGRARRTRRHNATAARVGKTFLVYFSSEGLFLFVAGLVSAVREYNTHTRGLVARMLVSYTASSQCTPIFAFFVCASEQDSEQRVAGLQALYCTALQPLSRSNGAPAVRCTLLQHSACSDYDTLAAAGVEAPGL